MSARDLADKSQHLRLDGSVNINTEGIQRTQITSYGRTHSGAVGMYGCFAVSRRNCRCIVRLAGFPKEFLLVVIQLITGACCSFRPSVRAGDAEMHYRVARNQFTSGESQSRIVFSVGPCAQSYTHASDGPRFTSCSLCRKRCGRPWIDRQCSGRATLRLHY